MAPAAAAADALSTAFFVSSPAAIRRAAAQVAGLKAWLVLPGGQVETLG
jgi:thiamine biosynthesis lipoprotein ApbE